MDNLDCSDFDFSCSLFFGQQSNKGTIHHLHIPFQNDDLIKPYATLLSEERHYSPAWLPSSAVHLKMAFERLYFTAKKGGKNGFQAVFPVSVPITDKEVALAIVQSQFLLVFPLKHCPRYHTGLFFIGLGSHPSAVLAVLRPLLDCQRVPRWPYKLHIPVGLLGHIRTSWDHLSLTLCSGSLHITLTSHTSQTSLPLTGLGLCHIRWSAVTGQQSLDWFYT